MRIKRLCAWEKVNMWEAKLLLFFYQNTSFSFIWTFFVYIFSPVIIYIFLSFSFAKIFHMMIIFPLMIIVLLMII